MNDPIVYFGPMPGGHKPSHPDAVYVRRPASYMQTPTSSASAIRVEAYANGGPREQVWSEGECRSGEMSEPIYVELVWVSANHRQKWDERTGHCAGTHGEAHEYMVESRFFGSELTDVDRVNRAIGRAKGHIAIFHSHSGTTE